jgi:hypothetical protein
MQARYLFLLFTVAAWPAQAQSWYYCDPLRTYYPYVKTCPAPWRPVDPANAGGRPVAEGADTQAPVARNVDTGKASRAGLKARGDWWTWRNGLEGSYRDGVNYWVTHRNTPSPGTCDEPVGVTPDPTWTQGCEDAKERLVPIDKNLKAEPGYRQGWRSFKPSPEAVAAARKARAEPQADAAPEPSEPPGQPAQAMPPAQADQPAQAEPPAQNGY